MGFDQGQLIFDHQDLVYHPGQEVTGKLVFNQEKVKKFRGLYVKLKGFCQVHWTTSHSRTRNNKTEHYTVSHSSHETYFKQKVFLKGGEQGEAHLQPGHHEFPFRCLIAPNCPSSFEGSNGHIRYECKVVVDRAFKLDQEKCRTLRVISLRDLNMDPYCKMPLHFEFQETYCCWCMRAGMCEMTVRMPQAGYCPGQTFNIDISCVNKSSVEIDTIKLGLKEHRKFIATSNPDTRSESHSIAKLKKGPIPGNTTRNWTVEMDIPLFDLYNVDACQYIDIHHTFEVTLSPSGCHSDTDDTRRIVLGHIPLREFEAPSPRGDVIAQPLAPSMSQFPNHQEVNPYPVGKLPIATSISDPSPPYPGASAPNSDVDPPPYPGTNSPYPGVNPPYPGVNPPYPGVNPPYPGVNPPNPVMNPPYPVVNPPYPSGLPTASPYPVGSDPYSQNPVQPVVLPMPGMDAMSAMSAPALPPNANVPYPQNSPMPSNPFASASAPEPNTPDVDGKPKF